MLSPKALELIWKLVAIDGRAVIQPSEREAAGELVAFVQGEVQKMNAPKVEAKPPAVVDDTAKTPSTDAPVPPKANGKVLRHARK